MKKYTHKLVLILVHFLNDFYVDSLFFYEKIHTQTSSHFSSLFKYFYLIDLDLGKNEGSARIKAKFCN